MDESNKHNSINISTSKKNLSSSYVDQLRLVSLPKLITESSYINPNVCLNRKDILEEDKKKVYLEFSLNTARETYRTLWTLKLKNRNSLHFLQTY